MRATMGIFCKLAPCAKSTRSRFIHCSSQVFSTDIFDNFFKQIPICKAEGRRYRHMLLEKGGSEDEMKNLEEFLGRKSTPEAFHLQLGLAANRCQGR